ncbi:glycoside hydrolase family 55 protein [Grosmannia clavigera kw1407]|uniref:Glycoside hydrolase family 55 protein n=1 Tax=Grosmannia clavigera (strain kw1407 / UAMH 11150) TaxID=655863 RepID=F0XPI1_GROCL|nr:glycoside hydrolase family 55 protein [Grosmannia clavigera kw1407]EFX00554.1 glycoside hydrolase family 55 protein [Grosmannia clavigera kw1407]
MFLFTSLVGTLLLAARLFSTPVAAAPAATAFAVAARSTSTSTSSYWVANIARNGAPAFGTSGYKVYRNVRDYGAVGDGVTDDTAAINLAISDGNRCGEGCSSSTTAPALVYFPPGTYLVSTPIIQYYYTQLVGDAINPPTLVASASFVGIAVIDSDPYDTTGTNWWVNQNNFFRQVRNFKIDLTKMPVTKGAGIHWQVAQATSLQNIVFNMAQDSSPSNKQVGVFMDNGSGGFMADLTFIGGQYGAFFGNQQFTTRNMTFRNCQTAIYMNWNWAWTLQDISISNCSVGVDMSSGSTSQTVGSVLLVDSVISNTPIGVRTAYSPSTSATNGTLVLDNVDMSSNVPVAVAAYGSNTTVLAGNVKVTSWAQGNIPGTGSSAKTSEAVHGSQTAVTKSASLLNSAGNVFSRNRPQYETVDVGSFVSVKAKGAKGDGVTDDTAALQAVFDSATSDQIVYFDHGAYLVTDTIKVPKNVRVTGEVGQPGESGSAEFSDLLFATAGPQPGAVMIEWNLAGSSAGAAGLWDVHVRIGGAAGTDLQLSECAKNPNVTAAANTKCLGAGLLLHITASASSVYVENAWFWVADHDLEPAADNAQINVFNGRGVLIESAGPVWMIGTAAEHSVLYNYQLSNASNIYMGLIQTETPYFQGNPDSRTPFAVQTALSDPDFSSCTTATCARSWGLRVANSSDVFIYGAGLYSFFDNYDQTCLETESCQENMVSLESSSKVHIFGLNTKASINMVLLDGESVALDSGNRNNFCATLAMVSTES